MNKAERSEFIVKKQDIVGRYQLSIVPYYFLTLPDAA